MEREMTTKNQTRYKIGGMDCASCAAKIDTAVRRIPGVEGVSVSVTAGTMMVSYDGTCDLPAVEKKVVGLGYSLRALGAEGSSRRAAGSCMWP
jgi:Cd2+/Zn2+-exporting ATPase